VKGTDSPATRQLWSSRERFHAGVSDCARPSQPTAVRRGPSCRLFGEISDAHQVVDRQAEDEHPYRLAEWVPDKHVHLQRFASNSAAPGEASGYAGRRLACIEHIYFVPVPEVSSRVAGVESGDYDYGQNLSAETYKRLSGTKGLKTLILKPYYEIVMHLNTQNGVLKECKLRRAMQLGLNQDEIMLAAAGDKALYRLDPSLFFKEQYWHSDVGANRYNERDVAKAKALVKEGGYDGSPIRIITSSDFQFMYNAALRRWSRSCASWASPPRSRPTTIRR
jgi:ABC-type transport system substrate-binding protein